MTYKRILVAVDESKTSQIAFKEAINFIKPLHAKLCIFHVIEKLPNHVAYAIDVIKYQKLVVNSKKTAKGLKK